MIATTIKKHLVMSLDEQYAIVNALAFYDAYHSGRMEADEIEQFKFAYREDNRSPDFIDKLATKIANIH